MRIIPPYIKFLFKIALASVAIMTVARIALYYLTIFSWEGDIIHLPGEIFSTFLMGLRYDNVIIAYILFAPFVILGFASFFTSKIHLLIKGVTYYLICAYIIVLLILCTDIPYFLQFNSRLNTAALLWIDDSSYMLSMIFNDWTFTGYFILFLLLAVGSSITISKFSRRFQTNLKNVNSNLKEPKIIFKVAFFVILGIGLIISARGSISNKSPIKIGTAYFSNDQTLNRIALNPVFTFGNSLKNDLNNHNKIELMDKNEAYDLSSQFLKLPANDSSVINLFNSWKLKNDSSSIKKNVVIVIMESMGSFKMGNFHGPKNLTPNLNNIAAKSIYFNNIYTAGIHTFTGIYSTLFSFPAIYKQQPLEQRMDIPHTGIAQILQKQGYSTSYFCTHDPNFDNVSGFLKANGYQNIFSEYPSEINMSANGVPDHYLFDYSLPTINKLSGEAPFLAVFMTASDHKPYIIPDNIEFEPHSEKIEDQITEYSDWSIGKFLADASKQNWYENTIFVFIADHGLNMGHTYDMPLSYHHSPLIIYTPSQPQFSDTLHCLGGQIDIAPTILGLLDVKYQNYTMGINLFTNCRPFMYFSSDDKIGCLDNEYYYILRPENIETLYRYENLSTTNYINEFPAKVDSMKNYTFSMMQSTQEIMKQNIVGIKSKVNKQY